MKTHTAHYSSLIISLFFSMLLTACGSKNSTKAEQTSLTDTVNMPLYETTKLADAKLQSATVQNITATKQSLKKPLMMRSQMEPRGKVLSKSKLMPEAMHYQQPFYNTGNIQDNENYASQPAHSVKQTLTDPLSTFSIDVDTGSYSNIRRLINNGTLPLKDAVRVEEMLNYFQYDYSALHKLETDKDAPFIVQTEIAPSPWAENHHLLQVGIKAVDITEKALPAANLVFLVDVSGSMSSSKKLGLLKQSLKLLLTKMRKEDSIALVVYAGASGVVLEPTSGDNKYKITNALNRLTSGGSTNGASGIKLAYEVAQRAYIKNGINRILLATDGDFNVGTVNFKQLINLVENKRESGISLSTLGFGSGNYNDHLMEQLADAANGNYSYIDTLKEAQKVLVDEISSSLKTVAKDVKLQIEFNPAVVAEYRLIGYDNRQLKNEDFNNDKVDAGDIGAGHTVTALYDIVLNNSHNKQIDSLRYQAAPIEHGKNSNELAFVKIRYKNPDGIKSQLISEAVTVSDIHATFSQASDDFRFACSVAAFGGLLRGGQYMRDFNYNDVISMATAAKADDPFAYRGEFILLVKLANTLNITALQ